MRLRLMLCAFFQTILIKMMSLNYPPLADGLREQERYNMKKVTKTDNIHDLSTAEINRLEWMVLIKNGYAPVSHAQESLGLGRAQIYKIFGKYRSYGHAGLRNSQRGRASNRAFCGSIKARVITLIKDRYPDFGPTLIAEMLKDIHNIKLAVETIRQWMIGAGLWCLNKAKRRKIHRPRKRSLAFGEQVQIDGSTHAWFEDRADPCTLMVHVDDATGEVLYCEFFRTETGNAYLSTTKACVASHGRPLTFITDHHSGVADDYKKALADLNIIHSFANSPRSKGRVERMNRTLQDRLVKAMRLECISSIEAANEYLPKFIAKFNAQFAKEANNPTSKFRPLRKLDDLDYIFTKRYERKVSRQLTFSLGRKIYVIGDHRSPHLIAGSRVEIRITPNGTMSVWHKGEALKLQF
jgi:hypothetical protein